MWVRLACVLTRRRPTCRFEFCVHRCWHHCHHQKSMNQLHLHPRSADQSLCKSVCVSSLCESVCLSAGCTSFLLSLVGSDMSSRIRFHFCVKTLPQPVPDSFTLPFALPAVLHNNSLVFYIHACTYLYIWTVLNYSRIAFSYSWTLM